MTKKNELGVPTSRWLWMTVVVLILAIVGAGVRNYFFGPYADLKKRVHEIGNERIQEWAVNLLNSHHPIRKVEKIPPADIPDDIQAAFQGGYLVPPEGGEEEHVQITLGRKFSTYGLLIGHPGYVPKRLYSKSERWADGVWGWKK